MAEVVADVDGAAEELAAVSCWPVGFFLMCDLFLPPPCWAGGQRGESCWQPARLDLELVMHILGVVGSLRQQSLNRSLLRAAAELARDSARVELYELNQIPLYNADVEAQGEPEAVAQFKAAIEAADGLMISSPEYNHGIPGVLKNALDWASRPMGQSALLGKPVAILGASPSIVGTARMQQQLKQVLCGMQMQLFISGEFLCGQAHERFDKEGRLTDDETRTYLERFVSSYLSWLNGRVSR
jgi:chromate reductase